jgi:hypothetical protein
VVETLYIRAKACAVRQRTLAVEAHRLWLCNNTCKRVFVAAAIVTLVWRPQTLTRHHPA